MRSKFGYNLKKIVDWTSKIFLKGMHFSMDFLNNTSYIRLTNFMEIVIANTDTIKWHFAKCNHTKCNSIFLVHPEEKPGDLGFICPDCSRKIHDNFLMNPVWRCHFVNDTVNQFCALSFRKGIDVIGCIGWFLG